MRVTLGLATLFLATLTVGSSTWAVEDASSATTALPADALSVRQDVKYIMPPYFHGSASGFGAILGDGVGSLLAKGVSDEATAISAYMDQQHIDVGANVRTEFETALAGRPDYASRLVANDKNADGATASNQLALSVKYGLTKIGFGGGYKPYLWVEVRQFNYQQREQWMVRDYVGAMSKLSKDMGFEQFFSSPEAFTEAFVVAAKELAPLLAMKLKAFEH